MRISKTAVGLTLLAALALTGCSSTSGTAEKPSDTKPSAATTETTAAPETNAQCPELKAGDTIEGTVLGGCIAEAMQSTAGFASNTSVLGMEVTTLYNPAEKELKSTSQMGSVIVIGDKTWVQLPGGAWQVGDPSSSDSMVAQLSKTGETLESADPAVAAKALNGTFTVTGTDTRLGQPVTVLEGDVDVQGVTSKATYYVTQDYVALATSSATDANGTSVVVTMDITEWNKKQDITAPM